MKRHWPLYVTLLLLVLAAGYVVAFGGRGGGSSASVPESGIAPDWIATTTAAGTFSYPQNPLATYTSTVDWPPVLKISSEPFSCTQAGPEVESVGKTEQRMVGDRAYCVTAKAEGAAGSTYTTYAYAWQRGSGTATLTFTVRQPQCLNYDDPQKIACLNERQTFDLDAVVDRIVKTVK